MNKPKKYLVASISLISIAIPMFAAAQTSETLASEITAVTGYLNQFLVLLMGLALLMFVFYVVKYFIIQSDGATSREEGRNYILWSIVGFFVILSIWGIVNIFLNTFDLDDGGNTPTSQSISSLFPQ